MLLQDLALIVQYPESDGYRCRGFRRLRLAGAVYVVFGGDQPADQSTAALLGEEFCNEVLRQAGVVEEKCMPCSSLRGNAGCHATREPSCRKILVRPSALNATAQSGTWPTPSADARWQSARGNPTWEVVPVLPAGAAVAAHVPAMWQGINACFWTRHPTEAKKPPARRADVPEREHPPTRTRHRI